MTGTAEVSTMARDIAVIRRDIEETRGRLRDTAEAIGWKADVPARARDILRETAGVVRERVAHGHTAGNGHGGASTGGPGLLDRARSAMHGVAEGVGSAKESAASAAHSVGDTVGSARESVASTASAVGDKVGSARESVAGGAGSASDTAGSAVDTVKEHMPTTGDARAGARRAVGVAKGNPMALAIGALVLGAAAGLTLPSTRVEDERIGPVADDLREQGAEKATEAVRQSREVISETASEAAERGKEAVEEVRERTHQAVGPTG
jgi:hypothetical protein